MIGMMGISLDAFGPRLLASHKVPSVIRASANSGSEQRAEHAWESAKWAHVQT